MPLNNQILIQAFKILPRSDRKRLYRVAAAQLIVGLLDLIGVIGIGLLGTLAVTGISSTAAPTSVQNALNTLKLDGFTFQTQVAIIAIVIGILLIGRTVLSVILNRRILRFLSMKSAEISEEIYSRLINSNLELIQARPVSEYIHILSAGVSKVSIGIIGTATTVFSDGLLLLALGIGLFIINPITALVVSTTFFAVGYLLYFLMHIRALKLGETNARVGLEVDALLMSSLLNFREISAKGQRSNFSEKFSELTRKKAVTNWEIAFMPSIGKYVIEGSIVIGTLLIAGFQFLMQDAVDAIGTLTIFLAAGTRIAPAVLRIQQGLIQIKESYGSAKPTLALITELENRKSLTETKSGFTTLHATFEAHVIVDLVNFKYVDDEYFEIKDISFEILPGEFMAVVGSSGSGKTTLVDLVLGLITPESGSVKISGLEPRKACSKWPGAIAYISQNSVISKSILGDEVILGYERGDVAESKILNALSQAQLDGLLRESESVFQHSIGVGGNSLSGGQRQRVNIARGLISSPKFIVLDEATSALDGLTEASISEEILRLKGNVTLLVIAHRLTTIKHADRIIYIRDGKIIDIDTFDNLKNKHVDFLQQAQIMGL
jgi:ABC-type bacteriocin/lantibiotic exporter with double-glycine peptidase domain